MLIVRYFLKSEIYGIVSVDHCLSTDEYLIRIMARQDGEGQDRNWWPGPRVSIVPV